MPSEKAKTAIIISVLALVVVGIIGGITLLISKAKAHAAQEKALAELKEQNPVEYYVLHTPLRQKNDELRDQMAGTWRLLGAKSRRTGGFVFLQPSSYFFKAFTETNWSLATYDASSNLLYSAGGRYTLLGENYAESIDEATGMMKQYLHGHPQFKIRLVGDKFYQMGTGKDPNVVEMWQRVE